MLLNTIYNVEIIVLRCRRQVSWFPDNGEWIRLRAGLALGILYLLQWCITANTAFTKENCQQHVCLFHLYIFGKCTQRARRQYIALKDTTILNPLPVYCTV